MSDSLKNNDFEMVWSEDPEMAYFQDMMVAHGQDMDPDDSVFEEDLTVGSFDAQTMATLERRVKLIPDPFSEDPYYQGSDSRTKRKHDHNPDFISKKDANTTNTKAAKTQGKWLSILVSHVMKIGQKIDLQKTSEKKEKSDGKTNTSSSISGDTAPESPSRARGALRDTSHQDEGQSHDREDARSSTFSTKRKYCAAGFGLFLIVAIAVCSNEMSKLRERTNPIDSKSDIYEWDFTLKPTSRGTISPKTDAPTISLSPLSPTRSPSRSPLTPADATTTKNPISGPTLTPSIPASTLTPTVRPTVAPTLSKLTNFDQIMSEVSTSIMNKIRQGDSSQARAFEWLVNDPDYFSYSANRIIQRWALAVFKLEITAASNRRLQSVVDGTMQYTDECTWFEENFDDEDACDSDGNIEYLYFKDLGLVGTIPSELFLLSKLDTLVLANNAFTGTIPDEIGACTSLEVLRLENNRLEGTMPDAIFELEDLDLLDLGHNLLTGTIPEKIGNVKGLETCKLDENRLSGKIPVELMEADALEVLDLRNNMLTGTVPLQIMHLESLERLELSTNNLVGVIPNEVCDLNLGIFTVDCNEVSCGCCEDCETESPTRNPTKAPLTAAPTEDPLVCRDKVTTEKSCFRPGEYIPVNFVNCDPQRDDWIGLYDSGIDDDEIDGDYERWYWICGSQSCQSEVQDGALFLDDGSYGDSSWPLDEGTYKVHILRNGQAPYESIGKSEVITVSNSC